MFVCILVRSSLHCLRKMFDQHELVAHVQHHCQKLVGQHCQLVPRDQAALVLSRGMFLMYYSMNQIFQKVGWCTPATILLLYIFLS